MSKAVAVPWVLTLFGLIFVCGFFLLLAYQSWLPSAYFKLYDENIVFFSDYRINSPTRCVIASIIVFINTAVNTYIGLEVGSWQTSYLFDKKSPYEHIKGQEILIIITTQLYNWYRFIASVVGIYFLFTSFFFLVIQALGATVVSTYFFWCVIKDKKKKSGHIPKYESGNRDALSVSKANTTTATTTPAAVSTTTTAAGGTTARVHCVRNQSSNNIMLNRPHGNSMGQQQFPRQRMCQTRI